MPLIKSKKEELTPRKLREHSKESITSTISVNQLTEGAERQYKRYHNVEFQRHEFKEKIERVFGHK